MQADTRALFTWHPIGCIVSMYRLISYNLAFTSLQIDSIHEHIIGPKISIINIQTTSKLDLGTSSLQTAMNLGDGDGGMCNGCFVQANIKSITVVQKCGDKSMNGKSLKIIRLDFTNSVSLP